MKAAENIQKECQAFVDGDRQSLYSEKLEKFKSDLLAQIHKDCKHDQIYSGLTFLIDLSWGVPRHLLMLLKHIFSWAIFNGDNPNPRKPISLRAQREGIAEASEWFFNDSRKVGADGKLVQECISRLGNFFRAIRYSDKPSECSVSGAFSFQREKLSSESQRMLDIALQWSLLVDVGVQSERNSGNIELKVQLNRMLAPRWDLANYRRGVFSLQTSEADAIFQKESQMKFEEAVKRRVARMMAPSFRGSDDGHDDLLTDIK